MPCDTRLRTLASGMRQSISQRAAEVRAVQQKVEAAIAAKRVKVKVGPQGAIAFDGITDDERAGISDACIYRRIMVTGSALARAAVAQAERLAGRSIDRAVVGHGAHSHDGGRTWHSHKG